MNDTVLVLDDEREIADLVSLYLCNEGYNVNTFYEAKDALGRMEKQAPDLAILDVMLPDMDGFSVCQKIRQEHTCPIIMLTARDDEIDKITGLTLGADDYITKPFRPLEMVARVKAQLRRYKRYGSTPEKQDDLIAVSGLTIDLNTYECTLDGSTLALTPTEFSILRILCQHKGGVVSSEDMFHEIWGDEYYTKNNNTITVHIRHLREKMGESIEHPKCIKTVWGVGYKIEAG